MISQKLITITGIAMLCMAALAGVATAQAPGLGTAITYQGQLMQEGKPVDSLCDFQFVLYDKATGGAVVSPVVTAKEVPVTAGLFTVPNLDFGNGIFAGEQRWLAIAISCPTGAGFVDLAERQEITPAPHALFAAGAPWSGLTGLPAGFADGVDNGTTYTAGAGLSLTGAQFSVNFDANGVATTAARSDHNHLGQTWIGSNNALVIDGGFSTAEDPAPLVLSNSTGSGLAVSSAAEDGVIVVAAGAPSVSVPSLQKNGLEVAGAQGHGLYVGRADLSGVVVSSAANDGVYVASAGTPSTHVMSTNKNGFEVAGAQGDGLYVGQAGNAGVYVHAANADGVHVQEAGAPSVHTVSALANGLEVAGAHGNGLYIGRADENGVHVASAAARGVYVETAGTGVQVDSAGGNGLAVGSAGDDGVYVYEAGTPTTHTSSPSENGFEVAGASGYGLYVGRAEINGVYVASAYSDGLSVYTAGDDGVYVYEAGDPAAHTTSTGKNGFEVAGAQDNGLFVGRAEASGVVVNAATNEGLHVQSAGRMGVWVESAETGGVVVGEAGNDGLAVQLAGGDGVNIGMTGGDGLDVISAGANGVNVQSAVQNGVNVGSATQHGVYVSSASVEGVRVESAGRVGVWASTARDDHEWGFLTPDKIRAGTLVSAGYSLIAQVTGAATLAAGDLAAAAGVGQPLPGEGEMLPLVQPAGGTAGGVIGVVESRMLLTPDPQDAGAGAPATVLRSAEGPAQPGEYVALRVLGVTRIRIDSTAGEILPGQRLVAASVAGAARGLQSRSLEGMVVAEGAPVIGIALGPVEGQPGLVWAYVNPQ